MERLILLLIVVLTVSCDSDAVYKRFDKDFDQNRWMASDVREHEFDIPSGGTYDISVDFSHVYGVPLESLPMTILLQKEGNEPEQIDFELRLADGDKPLSDCTGDYCDLRQVVIPTRMLQPGKYSIRLSHNYFHEFIPNVLGVGIRINNSENVQ